MRDQIQMIDPSQLDAVNGGTELPKSRANMLGDAIRSEYGGRYADVMVGNADFSSGAKGTATAQFRDYDGSRYDATCSSQRVVAGRFGAPSIDPVLCTNWRLAR